MLQVIVSQGEKYSLGETAQMAVEAGAGWLLLSLDDMTDEEIRQEAADVINLCREAGVILTVKNRVELAEELHLHGVFITDPEISPLQVRQKLGAEAIIGTVIGSPDAAFSMEKADIDYVALSKTGADAQAIIEAVRAAGCAIPVVAYRPDTELNDETVQQLLAAGFSGICGGTTLFRNSADPVSALQHILSLLS